MAIQKKAPKAVREPKAPKFKPLVFNRKQFAHDILYKREQENISFRAFTEQTGLPWSVLYGFEASRNVPNADTLGVILAWLGADASDYFSVKK